MEVKMPQRRLAVILYLGVLASSADAHHSHPYFYDECKSITVEGRVERVEFKDPHTWISIRRAGDSFSWALPPRANPPKCG
jgi:hypothetical protein